MFSVSQDIYAVISLASRWIFVFFALMLLLFALSWHHSDRREHRDRFRNLPEAGTVGELVVLSGNDELLPDTWFPVPREGVLGSLRSCDLVVPCPGVRSQHLDFSWQDGTGLLIRPRTGCEVLVDGVPVTRRGTYAYAPLVHGSVLQVGSAVLRLQLFSALSHTNRTFVPPVPVAEQDTGEWVPSSQPSVQQIPPAAAGSWQQTYPVPSSVLPQTPAPAQAPPVLEQAVQIPSEQPGPGQVQASHAAPRRKRADRWKEDWSE